MADVERFGHEPPGVNTRTVLKVVGVLLGSIVVALVILYFAVMAGLLAHHAQVVHRAGTVPPPPRLQPHPDIDLTRLRREKRAALTNYSWVGPQHDFAHIPIKRAMQIYVREHQRKRQPSPRKGAR